MDDKTIEKSNKNNQGNQGNQGNQTNQGKTSKTSKHSKSNKKTVIFESNYISMGMNNFTTNKCKWTDEKFINMFDRLNDDVLGLIFEQIPDENKIWLNKSCYLKHHKLVRNMIDSEFYEAYVLDMVKQDYAFVFTQIINERFDYFHKWKNYYFNDVKYHSFLIFLREFGIKNNSPKCVQIIDNMAYEKGFSPNWFKYRGIILHNRHLNH